jgi:hypothetical protein
MVLIRLETVSKLSCCLDRQYSVLAEVESQLTLSGTPSLNSSCPVDQSHSPVRDGRQIGRPRTHTMTLAFPINEERLSRPISSLYNNIIHLQLPKYTLSIDCQPIGPSSYPGNMDGSISDICPVLSSTYTLATAS